MQSSTKPEVYNISHCRQRRSDQALQTSGLTTYYTLKNIVISQFLQIDQSVTKSKNLVAVAKSSQKHTVYRTVSTISLVFE